MISLSQTNAISVCVTAKHSSSDRHQWLVARPSAAEREAVAGTQNLMSVFDRAGKIGFPLKNDRGYGFYHHIKPRIPNFTQIGASLFTVAILKTKIVTGSASRSSMIFGRAHRSYFQRFRSCERWKFVQRPSCFLPFWFFPSL